MDQESVKAAEGLGITAVQVKDITEALKEILKLTGIEVRKSDPTSNSHQDHVVLKLSAVWRLLGVQKDAINNFSSA